MPHGIHSTAQTAFRLPEGLLAWLRKQAAKERPVTMTGIVVRALEAERERCEGITTSTAPSAPVSPPRRKPRQPEAPASKRPAEPESASDIMAALRRRKTGGQ